MQESMCAETASSEGKDEEHIGHSTTEAAVEISDPNLLTEVTRGLYGSKPVEILVAGREGRGFGSNREEDELEGVDEDEEDGEDPRTRPWPLKEEEEEENGVLTFFRMPFIFSLTSSMNPFQIRT